MSRSSNVVSKKDVAVADDGVKCLNAMEKTTLEHAYVHLMGRGSATELLFFQPISEPPIQFQALRLLSNTSLSPNTTLPLSLKPGLLMLYFAYIC